MSKVLGIIAEYNPFHNGHLYHIETAKNKAKADTVVAVITGNFTQRGNTSIVDKWEKAKMAINAGCDLVIELPTLYSISSAENFALGAIKILNELEIIDTISFGMETEELSNLNNIANVLYNEPKEYKMILKKELSEGISYANARANALNKYLSDKNYEDILKGSNNILGIEYLKALKSQKSKIMPLGIKREKVYYNSKKIVDEYASSTGIRHLLERKQIEEIARVMPKESFRILIEDIREGKFNLKLSVFSKEIIYKLRSMSIKEIKNLPDVSEGLENLIKESANKTNNIIELINNIKSKRFTQTRIQRILLYSLLGITKKDMEMSRKVIPYVRVLGFNKNGKRLLSEINPNIKVITSLKKFENTNKNLKLKRMLEIDKYATDIYTLGYSKESFSNLDYTKGMFIFDN